MILNCSLLKVCDNSNVIYVKCFSIYIKFSRLIGSFLYVSVKNIKSKGVLRSGDIAKGMLVRRKKNIDRRTGSYLYFSSNDVVLLNMKGEVLGTRIFGLIPLELRKKRFLRIVSISSNFI